MMLGFLRGTTTPTGLRVSAEWWERTYSTGVKVTATEMKELALEPHDLYPRWNYTIHPRAPHPGH
jgi:hypothetical protein